MFLTTPPMVTFSTERTFSPRRVAWGVDASRIGAMRGVLRRGLFTPDHHPHERVSCHAFRRQGRYQLAVPEHRDAVGNLQRFFERMGNEDDASAPLLQGVEQMEKMLRLFGRERGGGFVEDEHPRVVAHGAHDLDHLTLGGSEIFDERQADRH